MDTLEVPARVATVDDNTITVKALHRIDPNFYTPIKDWQTRILRLHPGKESSIPRLDLLVADVIDSPGLVLHDEQERVEYGAISYTWGGQAFDSPILLNGIQSWISKILAAALKTHRLESDSRYVWADALCINQSDDEEKSFQVRNMFKIFHKANAVLVQLDEEDFGCSSIYDTKWAKRVWVQQEIFAARDVFVNGRHSSQLPHTFKESSGRLRMAGEKRLLELRFRRHDMSIQDAKVKDGRRKDLYYWKYCHRCDETSWQHSPRSESFHIECLLHRHRHCEASDARDFVYGLISMTDCAAGTSGPNGRAFLPIDYSRSLSQLYQDVTRHVMNRERNISILEDFVPDAAHLNTFPSWTLDWRKLNIHFEVLEDPRALGWQNDRTDGILELAGIQLGTVVKVIDKTTMSPSRMRNTTELMNHGEHNRFIYEFEMDCHPEDIAMEVSKRYRTLAEVGLGDWVVKVDGARFALLLRPDNPASSQFRADHCFRYLGKARAVPTTKQDYFAVSVHYDPNDVRDRSFLIK